MADVVIASGQPIERAALGDIVRAAGHRVAGEADSGQKALQLVRNAKPDLLVIATDLPRITGLEVLRRIKTRDTSTRTLLFGGETAAHFIQRCYEAGADGFVGRHEEPGELRRAISGVLTGHRYFPDFNAANGMRAGAGSNNPLSSLSAREVTILSYLARGFSNLAIAKELSISEKTVSSHRSHLRTKLNARSLVEFADIARQYGLLNSEEHESPSGSNIPEASARDAAILRAMLDGTPLPLHVRDREGRIVACNEAFLSFNETTFEAVEGSLFTESQWIDPATAAELQMRYLASVRSGVAVRVDREILHRGKRGVFHIWATPYRSETGELLGMVCGALDVTGREDMLKALALERDHGSAVTGSMERLLDALCRELAPLPALLREAQADAQGASEKGGLRERTGEAATRLEQVLAIVADVVDMGRGRLRRSITQVSVADLTGQVVERLQHAALAHGCSLSLQVNDEVAKPVSLDADTYGRLVYLLVGWQIVQHPGHALLVSLDVSTDAAGTPQLTLDVDALEAQSASAQASPGSVGEAGGALALLLGRRLVEHMHGTLQAHNTRGESSATIRLPLLAA